MDGEITFGPFRLCARERRLERDGASVKLGSRALEMLIALTERAGEVVPKEELTARVWPDTAIEENGLRVQMVGLRKALGDGHGGPRYVTTVPGRGYCFVAPLSRPAKFPKLARLPLRLELVIGRDADILALRKQLSEQRFVSVVGPGGMGKTTIAVAIAHALLAEFDGDVCFVDLSSLTDARKVPASIAAALGLAVATEATPDGLVAFLRDRRVLVVLDCCEHLLSSVAPLAERIVGDTARVHVLATSREPLRVAGEHAHRLPPLEIRAAVQLFVERAAATGAQLAITGEDECLVTAICNRLDGIALAIELAAARVASYGLRGVASLLDDRFNLLWRGRRTAHPRHQTLSADLDWSYDLLDETERGVLRRLACLVGPFSLQAGVAVASDAVIEPARAVDAIGSLVEKSLVAMEGGAVEARYRLLDTTRAYALGKLEEANERQPIARRRAEYFCALLETDHGAEHLANVRAALEWSFSAEGDKRLATRLAAASVPLFMNLSLLKECQGWVEAALAMLDAGERGTRLELRLQAALGVAWMFTRGHAPDVRAALSRGLALAEEVDDPQEQLRLSGALNLLLTRAGEFRDSLQFAVRSEALAERLMDPAVCLLADWMVGTCRHLLGDQAEAERRFQSALEPSPISRLSAILQFGFDHRIRALVLLARVLWFRGRADEAKSLATRAVREAAQVGQPTSVAMALLGHVSVFLWAGDLDGAEPVIHRVIDHCVKHSLQPNYWLALGMKGQLAVARGDPTGLELLSRAIESLQAKRHEIHTTILATSWTEGLAGIGRSAEALEVIDDAIATTAARNGSSFDMPEMLRVKGLVLAGLSPGGTEAERCLVRAVECAHAQGALAWELRAGTALARLLAARGRAAEGRERLSATYQRFTQGLETADLVAARQLLAEL